MKPFPYASVFLFLTGVYIIFLIGCVWNILSFEPEIIAKVTFTYLGIIFFLGLAFLIRYYSKKSAPKGDDGNDLVCKQ